MSDQLLERIKRVSARRIRAQSAIKKADAELRGLVREAFAAGHTAQAIADSAGLSAPRVYQIRDGRR
ncbi:hypothetical protein [Mycobacterium talmoniae]|uniref:Resolvase HTH domain-containing protein n=1 Tax=Mycobacterium talmoniae TaxID=1858794 RepID=A0A1S1NDL4_9MYCO|nr:hypothetical protein [Mycobacterium talmoniae]OHV03720.1 hypothetical protein BKN37_13690 [Mycobacterium talmoniae]